MRKIAVALAGAIALTGLATLPATAGGQEKVSLCHAEEDGTWSLISIAKPAEKAHLKHGDVAPGAEGLDEECKVVETTPTVTEGPATMRKAGEVRFKGQNSGGEVYVGLMTDSSAKPRNEANYDGIRTTGTHPVTISFDPATKALTGTIDGVTVAWDYADGATDCAPTDADVMQITVRDGKADAGAAFTGVTLNGHSLGSFGAIDLTSTSWLDWTVTDVDFGKGFTLAGNLDVDNFYGNEAMKLNVTFGCSA